MSWHIDAAIASAYSARTIDRIGSASVEAHVAECATCWSTFAKVPDPPTTAILEAVWESIDAVLDRPTRSWTERVLIRLGCSERTARIAVAGTRARWSYLTAVALSMALAVVSAQTTRDAAFGLFLLIAPLGPLLATVTAFGRWADPTFELQRSVPTSRWTIAAIRTAIAVVPAIALTALSVPILDERGWLAAGWLLPSLALCLLALALARWLAIETAGLAVMIAWLSVPLTVRAGPSTLLAALSGPVQYIAAASIAVAAVVIVADRAHLDWSNR